jgi:hypothetical protein
MSEPIKVIEIYISYSHVDRRLMEELERHLKALEQQFNITIWHDGMLLAGQEWQQEINKHLNSSQIILMLVSPDYLASEFTMNVELGRALERHERGEARVIPIILADSDWLKTPLGKLQALPNFGKPVNNWEDREEAFEDIVTGIKRVIEELPGESSPTSQPVISKVDPSVGMQGTTGLPLMIQGKYFRFPKSVRLIQDTKTMEATDIISSDTQIQCKIMIPANQQPGKWDLIVVNEDGSQDRLAEAFEVTVKTQDNPTEQPVQSPLRSTDGTDPQSQSPPGGVTPSSPANRSSDATQRSQESPINVTSPDSTLSSRESQHPQALSTPDPDTPNATNPPPITAENKFAQALITEGQLERDAVQQKATSDVPTQNVDEDKLGFDIYVHALRDFIASPETSTPLTIGIYGAWGSGKSSLMYMVKNELDPSLNFWSRLWLKRLWLKWFLSFLKAMFPWMFGNLLIWVDDRIGGMKQFQQAHIGHLNESDNEYRVCGPKKFRDVRYKKLPYDSSTGKSRLSRWLQKVRADLLYDPTDPNTNPSINPQSASDSNQASQSNNTEQRADASQTDRAGNSRSLSFWQWVAASHFPILPPTHPTIWFNAWKFDQEEQLWAALALEVLDQIKRKYNFFQRIIFWFRLMFKRFSFAALWRVIMTMAFPLFFGLVYLIYTSYMKQLPHMQPFQVFGFQIALGQLLLGAGIAVSALIQILKIARDPFQLQMKDVFDKPNYKDKIGFLGSFQEDFARIVSLATEPHLGWQPRKLVIFIDDLDRCEPPKAADIIEGINLFLDSQRCVFVLGMDPAAVVASIENKYKDLFEKMRQENIAVVSPGRLFLDKIIQVPFQVPQSTEPDITKLVADIMQQKVKSNRPANIHNGKNAENGTQPATPPSIPTTQLKGGEAVKLKTDLMQHQEPLLRTGSLSAPSANQPELEKGQQIDHASYKLEHIQTAIKEGAKFLPENPRQVKKYMNLFRFYVYIADARGLIRFREEGADKRQMGLTLNRLAIWVAWSVRWSAIAKPLSEEVQMAEVRDYLLLISRVLKKDGCWFSMADAVQVEPEFGNSTLFPLETYERRKYRDLVYEKLVARISQIRQAEQNALSHWSHLPWEWWLLDLDFRKGVKEMESFWKPPQEDEDDWLLTVLTWTRITLSAPRAVHTTTDAKADT